MENCVVCCEQDWDDCFEIQEFVSKDTYVFKVSYLNYFWCFRKSPNVSCFHLISRWMSLQKMKIRS